MSILKALQNPILLRLTACKVVSHPVILGNTNLVKPRPETSPYSLQFRYTSFFNKLPADALWKGVTSVSNAGRKRGRGKGAGKKMSKDLNRGQVIGVGKVNMVWPGLTTPVLRGRELIRQQQLPEDPERDEKLLRMRNSMGQFRRIKLLPFERGWSGTKLPGRKVGPPEPVGDDKFEGFETIVLESKSVFNMTGNMGRKRQMSLFVVTGNQQGLGGFGLGKAIDGRSALKSAKNRAGQRVMFIERDNNHTVNHDFITEFAKTRIHVQRRPEGYGVIGHRAIKSICEVLGIRDLHAKIEGSTNVQTVTKAFFLGLLKQKSHQSIAEETGLNIVELKRENDYYPQLIASPSSGNVIIDAKLKPEFQNYILDNKVVLKRKKFPQFYKQMDSWMLHLRKTLRFRNHDNVRINLLAERGKLSSFLSDQYPKVKKEE